MEIKKEFNFKKGTEDWKIWDKVNQWLSKEISKKRKSTFIPRKIRKDIKVIVEVQEG